MARLFIKMSQFTYCLSFSLYVIIEKTKEKERTNNEKTVFFGT